MRPFHHAFPVSDLNATELFYVQTLGCSIGRRIEPSVNFHGHQIVAHLVDSMPDQTDEEVLMENKFHRFILDWLWNILNDLHVAMT